MKNRMYILLPMRSLMFIIAFLMISLISGEKLENLSMWWSVIASIINIFLSELFCFIVKNKI